jgi:1-acyl-sn-glycerol-3-phosphate acyltransferase
MRRRAELALYGFVRLLIFVVGKAAFRLSIEGRGNVPTNGPFILAPVHRSNLDFAIVAVVTNRRMRYMGKDSIWKVKQLRWFFNALGAFPVHRGTPDREAMRTVTSLLEGGEPVVMFPEGTRKFGPVVEELFDGVAYVAIKTGVPIVPVGIGGSEAAWPKGKKIPKPHRIHVVVGSPITPDVSGKGVPRRAIKEQTDRLRNEVQRLFDDAQKHVGAAASPAINRD